MKSYSSWLCFFLLACISTNQAFSKYESQDLYTQHCSSIIPRHNVTTRSRSNDDDSLSLPSLSTMFFSGGERFTRGVSENRYYMEKNIRLRLRHDYCYQTDAAGIYEVQGSFYVNFPFESGVRSKQTRKTLTFPVKGFWSEKSSKLCMVGSATWKGIDFDAVLKLKFNEENPTIYTSVVSGSLESTSSPDDPAFFGPIFIFSFPQLSNYYYNYSLVPKLPGGGVIPTRRDNSLSLDATEFCSVMAEGLRSLTLEYAEECNGDRRPRHCSPLGFGGDEFLPDFLYLNSIQCGEGARKARFVATFLNFTSYQNDEFSLRSTVIGELIWDDKNSMMTGFACRITNPALHFGNTVQDCTLRLSLRYPSVLNLRSNAKITGKIWSSKHVDHPGYFGEIGLTSSEQENRVLDLLETEYEYTEIDRARKSCTAANKVGKEGNVYPNGGSFEMRFDMNIDNGKGQAYFTPIWVGNDPFPNWGGMYYASAPAAAVADAETVLPDATITEPVMMSYRVKIYHSHLGVASWSMKHSQREIEMTAEGLYDARIGHLCMVGCRKVAHNSSSNLKDCEIVVDFHVPQSKGGRVNGIIRSTRSETDPLHFDDLVLNSSSYNQGEAERTIQRIDVEITMVLISNTLFCIFIALQIFHVKRNPEVPSSVSIVMLVVLSVGCMIPLVLNYEAMILGERNKQNIQLWGGGKLEANEVAVRVMTLVTLMLQLRLLKLVYTAKQRKGEKNAGFVSLALYIIGGLITLLLNWNRRPYGEWRYYVWEDLRSYGGVILDGFLVPQILFNMFGGLGIREKAALCKPFYIGTSMVRLMPHVYNQYRFHNYPIVDLIATYYYANPAIDLYSTAWDILIPSGIIVFAAIVFVQQRRGARCILPRRLMGTAVKHIR